MTKQKRKVGVLIGSLRRDSFSRKLAQALIARAPAGLDCQVIEIGDLPLYNEDLDPAPPPPWTAFRSALETCDALLFVTPEYNRSMPGCLKNATDVGSRPEGKNLFDGLPAAVVSVSPYSLGGFGANHALRQNFVYLNLAVMQQPEAYIANAGEVLDAHGAVIEEGTDAFLKDFMRAFDDWASGTQKAAEKFDDFLVRREKISGAYIQGEAGPLLGVSTTFDPASFFPPNGHRVVGAANVNATNEKGAKAFAQGSTGRFEIIQSGSSGGLGFWTGIQHAEVMMEGEKERVSMQLRTTEVFRIEKGQWRLVHRHADPVKAE